MKIPNFASWYHCGAWNFASDAQDGANGPRAATTSTRRTVSATPGSCALEEVASAARSSAGRAGRRPWIIGGPPADSTRSSVHRDPDRLAREVAVVGGELDGDGP